LNSKDFPAQAESNLTPEEPWKDWHLSCVCVLHTEEDFYA